MPRGREKRKMKTGAGIGSSHRLPISTFDGGKQRGRSTEENTRGGRHERGIKRRRTGQRATPAHRRAAEEVGWQGLRFSSGGSAGIGWRRCGKKVEFFNTARTKSKGGRRTGVITRGVGRILESWPAKGAATGRPPSRCWGGVVLGGGFISCQGHG